MAETSKAEARMAELTGSGLRILFISRDGGPLLQWHFTDRSNFRRCEALAGTEREPLVQWR